MIKELVSLRHDQKKSRVDVARKMGVTDVSLWHYETGKRSVTLDKLVLWAAALGYDVVLTPKEIKL